MHSLPLCFGTSVRSTRPGHLCAADLLSSAPCTGHVIFCVAHDCRILALHHSFFDIAGIRRIFGGLRHGKCTG